tara:strand:+ start:3359 stop:5185 length:1827 start_codon:yes stop_codon:yes gene_type:complete
MTETAADLPADYRDIPDSLPEGMALSSRIVEPLLVIRKAGPAFRIVLAGRRMVRGTENIVEAISPSHNWICDGNTIRPLPHDTPDIFQRVLDGSDPDSVGFPEVVRLCRLTNPPLRIEADDAVFTAAGLEAANSQTQVEVPGLVARLYPYQSGGVRWMQETVRHTGGLILADEMGLGKTIQIISLLLLDRPETVSPALIVCPTSLIANWRREIFQFAPELSVMVHRGAHRTGIARGLQNAQVILTTYDTLVNDRALFGAVTWSWVICDEAQAVKNPDSLRRQAVASVPRQRTIPMTGTPVETSLLDLWSLTDLAIPGLLGDRDSFEKSFPDDENSARELAKLTNPVVLRRRVADVAGDLPERIDIDVPLELGPELSNRYIEVLEETIERYPTASALVATGQLQIFCAHPWLQAGAGSDSDDDAGLNRSADMPLVTPKMERTVSLLDEAFRNGRKVLVFAVFNRCGDLIREAGRGLPPAFWGAINGATPQEERQKIVDDFSDHDGPGCLVLNPKAAGSGLNITAATIVIHYTQAWNPALEAQASARAHRRGQTEPVRIYRLFYEDTVERVMIDRSQWRRELGNEAVPVSSREEGDLRRALSIRPGAVND